MKTKIILVGGFLGAGKTTLISEAARKLTKKGSSVGLITNDQAPELVDTAFLKNGYDNVTEVSGSCFCCNFEGFTHAISHVNSVKQSDIIIAEPVGSCTDLSATILQPLKQKYGENLLIAPLSVLIDPEKLLDLLDERTSGLHSSAAYIIKKQLEEADIIVINKTDLLTQDSIETLKQRTTKQWPSATIFAISAKNKEGLESWLNEVTQSLDAGKHIAEVDYDIYAEGEAVLGWLNGTFLLQGNCIDSNVFTKNLLNSLSQRFDNLNLEVGHVKLLIKSGEQIVVGNLTGKKNTLDIRGYSVVGKEATLTLNARVQMNPDALKNIVLEEISVTCGNQIISTPIALKYLSPGRPNPTYRYKHIVPISS